jgi:hypothetical protein
MKLTPQGFNMEAIAKLLQKAKQQSNPLKHHPYSIEGVKQIESIKSEDYIKEMKYAIQKTTETTGYDAQKSYDCEWICDQVLQKIKKAQAVQATALFLDNHCCTMDTCPEVELMKFFIDALK